MITIERQIQTIFPGQWTALEDIDQKCTAVENRCGFPPKKRYKCVIGGLSTDMIVIERQWESMAALEATYEKILADPEYKALAVEIARIVEKSQLELYTPMP